MKALLFALALLPPAAPGAPEARADFSHARAALRAEATPEATPGTAADAGKADGGNASKGAGTDGAGEEAAARHTTALPPEKANPVRLKRFDRAPVIDGRLDEAEWAAAPALRDFFQTSPGDNIRPSQPTEVRLGYDSKHLYVAFRAYDEAGKVRATVARRDAVLEDDNVQLILDTFNDRRRAYMLIFNPLGVQQDGIFTEDRGEDFTVDVVMESKGALLADGYTVEAAIPFKSLRYEAGRGRVWGVHALRQIKRFNNETDSWMPRERGRAGWLNQAGRITGLEGISTERTLEIIPSLTVSETGRRRRTLPRALVEGDPSLADPGRLVNRPVQLDPGLTVKYGLTPTVTLDLALNPDFAQVEADTTVVTANQRFPIFFEEKRPFFLEGIDIFQTMMNVVNTRAIVDPDAAVKLTGKRGRNSFGLLFASDNAPGNFTEEERDEPELRADVERLLDKNASVGVLRLKRDVGRENSLGLFATTYNFVERHNHTGGFDGRFRLDPQTTVSFQLVGTHSRGFFYDPDRDRDVYRTGNAFGWAAFVWRETRRLYASVGGAGRTRDYRADVGFTRRVDTNSNELFFRYRTDPRPNGTFTHYGATNFNRVQYDWRGRLQGWNAGFRNYFHFARQSWVGFGFDNYFEKLHEDEFGPRRNRARAGAFAGPLPVRASHNKSFYVGAGTTPSKKYAAEVNVFFNRGALDLDFGAGHKFPRASAAALIDPDAPLDPGPGNSIHLEGSFSYQPTGALRATLNYTKSRLVRDDTNRVAFDARIFSLRSTYQFTRFLFARARVDYYTLSANARGQFLVGWAPNPGTALYVGYNDDVNLDGFSPFTGRFEPGMRRNERVFFIKMSYLFRRSFGG